MHNYPWLDFQVATTLKFTANQTAQTITNLTSTYTGAVRADITVDAAPIRYGFNYTPDLTTGHRYDRNQSIPLSLNGWDAMRHFQFVRGGATDAVMWCTIMFPKGAHPRG